MAQKMLFAFIIALLSLGCGNCEGDVHASDVRANDVHASSRKQSLSGDNFVKTLSIVNTEGLLKGLGANAKAYMQSQLKEFDLTDFELDMEDIYEVSFPYTGLVTDIRHPSRSLAETGHGKMTKNGKIYNNSKDSYKPDRLVQEGAQLSSEEFEPTSEYITSALVGPIVLFALGFISLFMLGLSFILRCCCKCCRCEPDDHHLRKGHENDTMAMRKHQIDIEKHHVLGAEIFLVVCVVVADCMCYYGLSYLQTGNNELGKALKGLSDIFKAVSVQSASLKGSDSTTMTNSIAAAKLSCPAGASILNGLDSFATAFETATKTLDENVNNLNNFIGLGEDYVNGPLASNTQTFVLVVFAIAFVSVVLIILFRLCKSTWGTEFAVYGACSPFFHADH